MRLFGAIRMHPRHALTLQTQLTLPLIPFAVDTVARLFLLGGVVPLYQIPDLVTLLATLAFFSLAVMFVTNPYALPADSDAMLQVELVRQRLLTISVVSIALAGGISFFRLFDQAEPASTLYHRGSSYLFVIVITYVGYCVFRIVRKYMSYIHRG